ncbi:VrrA/YqfQ family protein [Virgibacillus necropolis]|uniref:YqfQ-like protein n=1 Tax=Virgibacillus necropolis TaxID=163877 RepID=A0A221MD26_9BACI|nr:VrrA/YqfQ family protein [Virgibacillus necropolis]ASN05563.1 hypothetical protein CFK40_11355 [Virgibacillus necropolis]
MFPMNNRPQVPERQFNDPFSIRPNRVNRYPVPKSTTSIPASIASYLNPSSGGGLTKTLSNVQQVMNMVESAAPMIKEYGPMVKNLPMMLKMMKALKESDETGTESNTSTKEIPSPSEEPVQETIREDRTRQSKPKLFI